MKTKLITQQQKSKKKRETVWRSEWRADVAQTSATTSVDTCLQTQLCTRAGSAEIKTPALMPSARTVRAVSLAPERRGCHHSLLTVATKPRRRRHFTVPREPDTATNQDAGFKQSSEQRDNSTPR